MNRVRELTRFFYVHGQTVSPGRMGVQERGMTLRRVVIKWLSVALELGMPVGFREKLQLPC
ncbi:MAG: hypothetical protein ACJAUP_002128 [Cellvibrionaceae bacterium]|jgi:hypothetical protein